MQDGYKKKISFPAIQFLNKVFLTNTYNTLIYTFPPSHCIFRWLGTWARFHYWSQFLIPFCSYTCAMASSSGDYLSSPWLWIHCTICYGQWYVGRNDSELVLSLGHRTLCIFLHFLLRLCLQLAHPLAQENEKWVEQSCPISWPTDVRANPVKINGIVRLT